MLLWQIVIMRLALIFERHCSLFHTSLHLQPFESVFSLPDGSPSTKSPTADGTSSATGHYATGFANATTKHLQEGNAAAAAAVYSTATTTAAAAAAGSTQSTGTTRLTAASVDLYYICECTTVSGVFSPPTAPPITSDTTDAVPSTGNTAAPCINSRFVYHLWQLLLWLSPSWYKSLQYPGGLL